MDLQRQMLHQPGSRVLHTVRAQVPRYRNPVTRYYTWLGSLDLPVKCRRRNGQR